jgi:peptidoglycan/xylan/chitin deacetylase (PgdA/CDA1 family)
MMLHGHAIHPQKRRLARWMHGSALDSLLLRAQRARHRRGYVRVVNYHDTPASTAESLDRQLNAFQGLFSSVTREDLKRFFQEGRWHKSKPGLLLTFDDGLRSHFDVARPLLERYGFTGWFFVPTGFVEAPDQPAFAAAHRIKHNTMYTDGRIAMSWDELRFLAGSHVVGSHTHTHHRMTGAESGEALEMEIVRPKALLEAKLQQDVEAFGWVGGEEESYTVSAARCIREAGFRYAFTTCTAPASPESDPLRLHRTNIESSWPADVVMFQLSGVVDLLHTGKRKRVDRLLTG